MISKYALALVPLVGTMIGAFLGTKGSFEEQEDRLIAIATGILCSVCIDLVLECCEFVRTSDNLLLIVGPATGTVFTLSMNWLGKKVNLNTKSKLFWAMLIHNMPEGLVTGVELASAAGAMEITSISIVASLALQNVPDGLVVSMPLVKSKGKRKACFLGTLSGAVEPLASFAIIAAAAGNTQGVLVVEPLLTGFSCATILLIAVELYSECTKKGTILITAMAAILFKSLF